MFLICCWCISNEHYNQNALAHHRISTFAVLKFFWLDEFFDSLSEMEFGNCLMIWVGVDITQLVIKFLVSTIFRFSVTSRKSTSLRFVWMSIPKAMSLKILLIAFLLLVYLLWPLSFLKRINPSSWYNPKFLLQSIFSRLPWIKSSTSSHISAPSKLRMVHHQSFLLISFSKFISEKQ